LERRHVWNHRFRIPNVVLLVKPLLDFIDALHQLNSQHPQGRSLGLHGQLAELDILLCRLSLEGQEVLQPLLLEFLVRRGGDRFDAHAETELCVLQRQL